MKSLALRISFVVAVLAVLALALMPKVIGASIERATIDNLIALIPPEAQNQFEIRRDEFSDGWFSSSTTIELIYTPIGTDAIALTMDFDIDHGPLLQTENGLNFGLAYAVIKPSIRNDLFDIAIAEISFPLPDITLTLLARFDQSLWLNMNVSALSYSDTAGEFNFEGLDANVDVAADQSARFSVQMGEVSVQCPHRRNDTSELYSADERHSCRESRDDFDSFNQQHFASAILSVRHWRWLRPACLRQRGKF